METNRNEEQSSEDEANFRQSPENPSSVSSHKSFENPSDSNTVEYSSNPSLNEGSPNLDVESASLPIESENEAIVPEQPAFELEDSDCRMPRVEQIPDNETEQAISMYLMQEWFDRKRILSTAGRRPHRSPKIDPMYYPIDCSIFGANVVVPSDMESISSIRRQEKKLYSDAPVTGNGLDGRITDAEHAVLPVLEDEMTSLLKSFELDDALAAELSQFADKIYPSVPYVLLEDEPAERRPITLESTDEKIMMNELGLMRTDQPKNENNTEE